MRKNPGMEILKELLKTFISKKMQKDINSIKQAHENKDWSNIEKFAYSRRSIIKSG